MLIWRNNFLRAAVTTAALGITCCKNVDKSTLSAIYGQDDRLESIEAVRKFPGLEGLAAATFLLTSKNDPDAPVRFPASYGQSFNLCPGERFFSQPVQGFCTGVLVGPTLLLTASHCIRSDRHCQATLFIRNYQLNESGIVDVEPSPQDIFGCKRVVYREADSDRSQDIVLIELDRLIGGTKPLPVLRGQLDGSRMLQDRVKILAMSGHPRGLPKKVVISGKIRGGTENALLTNLDAFVGNSGSPVVDQDSGKLIGLLTKGGRDFEPVGDCNREVVCGEGECNGESVTLTGSIAKIIPDLVPQLQIIKIATYADIVPGESRSASLTFQNIGATLLHAGSVTVSSLTPGVTVAKNSRQLEYIGPGSVVAIDNYRFDVGADVDCGSTFKFRIDTVTSSTRSETEYRLLPGSRLRTIYEGRGAPLHFSEQGSFEIPIKLPFLTANAQIFPYIEIFHREPDQIEISVSPPIMSAGGQRHWYLQKLSDGRVTFGEERIWEQIFGDHVVPYQDLNSFDRPVPEGNWLIRVTDFSGVRLGEIRKAGFIVLTRKCQNT